VSRDTAPAGRPPEPRATLAGAAAIALWSTLALLTTLAREVQPFQLLAMAFMLAAGVGLARRTLLGGGRRGWPRWPWTVWAIGVGGLFGNHFCYVMALRGAPPAQANMVNYLWPLLIVLFSRLLPGERLALRHLAGAVLGLAGTAVVVLDDGATFAAEHAAGYAFALGAAVTWAGYSVLSRRIAHVPTEAVTVFCGATAALALVCHLLFETTRWPAPATWPAVVALGLGPLGLAFVAWDIGVKRGDIRLLAVAAYAIPPASTLILIAAGHAEPTARLALGCALIVAAAIVAAAPRRRRRAG
jgi:drug/metabolite transporter (DMT)-like permease